MSQEKREIWWIN